MVIDFHTHIFSPKIKNNRQEFIDRDPLFGLLYANPKAKLATAEDLIATMDEQGIDVSVTLNINWNNNELCKETNEYILESVSRYPDRLIGFGMVSFESVEHAIKQIEYCSKNGIKGIGEIRPDKKFLNEPETTNPIIQKIIDTGLVLLTHSSEPIGHSYSGKGNITPETLFPFIGSFPDLKLVCAHWGGGLPFYALMPEVKIALNNVYFDTAASPFLYSSRIYNQVTQLVGPEKILFGSDYPLLAPKRLLAEIDSLSLPKTVRTQILSGNASQLLGIKYKEICL